MLNFPRLLQKETVVLSGTDCHLIGFVNKMFMLTCIPTSTHRFLFRLSVLIDSTKLYMLVHGEYESRPWIKPTEARESKKRLGIVSHNISIGFVGI